MQRQIDRWSKRIVLVCIVIAALFGVTGLLQIWFEEMRVAALEKNLNQLRQHALRAAPNAPEDFIEGAAGTRRPGQVEATEPTRGAATPGS